MRIIAKRLLALEGGPPNPFEHMSDDDLMVRIHEINGQLMALGYAVMLPPDYVSDIKAAPAPLAARDRYRVVI